MTHSYSYKYRNRTNTDTHLIPLALIIAVLFIFFQWDLSEFFRLDRVQHIMYSIILFGVAFHIFNQSFLMGSVITWSLGFAKEWFDPTFEIYDIFANTMGLGLALVSFLVFYGFKQTRFTNSVRI